MAFLASFNCFLATILIKKIERCRKLFNRVKQPLQKSFETSVVVNKFKHCEMLALALSLTLQYCHKTMWRNLKSLSLNQLS